MKSILPHLSHSLTLSFVAVVGTLSSLSVSCPTARAEDKPASDAAAGDPDKMQEMMEKMAAAGTPGEKHQVLDALAGDWTVEVKTWMTPGAPPTVETGSAKAEWILGERYLREDFTGEMMGKPYHGMSILGYDNQKQKYNHFWIDDFSTSMFTSLGTASDDGKTITYEGKMDCPMTGEKDMTMQAVLQIVSPDEHVLTMYDPRQTEKVKSMEMTYKRK